MLIRWTDQPFLINVDWLSYNVNLLEPEPELFCPEGYRLEILPGNNIFRNRFILWNSKGEKILTCLWNPYSRLIKKTLMTAQVANKWLYEDAILTSYTLLQEVVQCEFNAVSRIDICCDFIADNRELNIVRRLNSGAMYVSGKGEGSIFWHKSEYKGHDTKFPHCLSWGSKTSEIKVKLYNKSREQTTDQPNPNPDKPYIVYQWQCADMDISKVWRLEFSLSSAGQLRYESKVITLEDVATPSWYVAAFMGMYTSRFDLRKNEGRRKGHHNDDTKVNLLPLRLEDIALRWKDTERHRLPDADVVTTLRKLMQLLESPTCMANVTMFDSVAAAVMSLVSECGLDFYVERKIGMSIVSYIETLRERIGCGIFEVEPSLSRSWS